MNTPHIEYTTYRIHHRSIVERATIDRNCKNLQHGNVYCYTR